MYSVQKAYIQAMYTKYGEEFIKTSLDKFHNMSNDTDKIDLEAASRIIQIFYYLNYIEWSVYDDESHKIHLLLLNKWEDLKRRF